MLLVSYQGGILTPLDSASTQRNTSENLLGLELTHDEYGK